MVALESRFGLGAAPGEETALPADLADWVRRGVVTRSQADTIAVVQAGRDAPARAHLDDWVDRGLLTRRQADSIRRLPPVAAVPVSAPAPATPASPVRSRPPDPVPRPSATVARPALGEVGGWHPDLRYVGMGVVVIAVLGGAGSLIGITTDIFIAPWRLLGADAGDLIHVVAALVCVVGAAAMYNGYAAGKPWAMAGLALNAGASVVFPGGSYQDPLVLVAIVFWLALLGVTARSRMPAAW